VSIKKLELLGSGIKLLNNICRGGIISPFDSHGKNNKLLNNKLHSFEKKIRQVKIYVASVKYLSSLLFHESLVSP
jgi:hypothetical protein